MIFPFCEKKNKLESQDFYRFSVNFSHAVLHHIPCADGPVTLLSVEDDGESYKDIFRKTPFWSEGVEKVKKLRQPVIISDDPVLFLPIWDDVNLFGVAVIEGVDPNLVDTLSSDWLSDRSRIISREFDLIRQLSTDPVTGLLNGRHLQHELNQLLVERTPFTLMLLEIYPKENNAEEAYKYITKACYYINSCFAQLPVYHLGIGVFAQIWPDVDGEQSQKLGQNVLDLLKREKFKRAHMGITSILDEHAVGDLHKETLTPDKLLDEAWQALRSACCRAPYAMSSFSSITKSEKHPLARPYPSVLKEFKTHWRGIKKFAVILLRRDKDIREIQFSKRSLTLLEAEAKLVRKKGKDIYVLLLNFDKEKAIRWANLLNEKIHKIEGATVSMGIATYPDHGFKKSDIPMNAKKALLHTQFYGPGSVTSFDAVSLNVSGDIYYNEGNLNRAVKEYRLGLLLDSNNINLMNSLGEAYAQMNRHKMAAHFFLKALQIDSGNYMALYNLGVARLMMGEDKLAIDNFEKALATIRNNPENLRFSKDILFNNYSDLLLQLSRLYNRIGNYQETINLLSFCADINNDVGDVELSEKRSQSCGGAFRHLGKAYKGLGKNQEAITFLQRAVRQNPRDASSLSLLGELYHQEKQGDEIALSLCKKAVDLDATRWQHWHRLGWLSYQFGNFKESQTLLQECLKRNRKCVPAISLLGQVYDKLGLKGDAIKMFKKAIRLDPSHNTARSALLAILKVNQ